jgi:hypothetical protein
VLAQDDSVALAATGQILVLRVDRVLLGETSTATAMTGAENWRRQPAEDTSAIGPKRSEIE